MEKIKQASEVTILGQKYAIKSEYEPAFMSETAAVVNKEMSQITDRAANLPALKVAILASMNIAGEYLKVKRENQRLRQEVNGRVQRILQLIRARI
jgi:cell division protein ZapA (FtsZ GTPase activity inhibitor)